MTRGTAAAGPGVIVASGWINGKVYRFLTTSGSPIPTADWSSYMGGPRRIGSVHAQ